MDSDDDEGVSFPIQEKIQDVKKTIKVSECQDSMQFRLIYHLRILIRGLTGHKLSGMHQSNIKDFSIVDGLPLNKEIARFEESYWVHREIP